MRIGKRMITLAVTVMMLGSMSTTCCADDSTFRNLFENAAYGGLAGAMIGGALTVFTDKPSDHLNNIAYGAAVGVIAGTVYGVVKTSQAMVTVENGKVKLAVPKVIPEFQEASIKSVMLKAELIRGSF